jgi:hypothetical protein
MCDINGRIGQDFFRSEPAIVGTSPTPIVPSMYNGSRDDEGHDQTFDERRMPSIFCAH